MKLFKYCLLFIFLLPIGNLKAENKKRPPNPDNMHDKKWEYLATEAQLSEQQIKLIYPIFLKYEQEIWDLHKKSRADFRKERRNTLDYETANNDYIEREVERAEALKIYHSELKKILSPETLYDYYNVERAHKLQLIYEMQHNQQRREQAISPHE